MTPERFAKLKRVLAARQPDLTVLMENVHKSHNIAAILRTCDAVGVYRANGVSDLGEIERHHMVSGGSRKWVDVRLHPDVDTGCARLRKAGHQVLAAHFSEQARDYREFDYTRPTAFLLGSELWGVTGRAATLADAHVAIPMEGLVSSLNVSVAAALLLYEARRQREAAGCYEGCRLTPTEFARTLFEWAHPEIARRCRERDLPYPPLTDDGDLARNPFAG
jgi:tRNA (guanosine-2'-O-)-methyltransferase